MAILILVGISIIGTIIFMVPLIFFEERHQKKWDKAVNSPEYLMDMAYLLSSDVNAFGGRRPGSEHKSVEECINNGFNEAPIFKARFLNSQFNKKN